MGHLMVLHASLHASLGAKIGDLHAKDSNTFCKRLMHLASEDNPTLDSDAAYLSMYYLPPLERHPFLFSLS